MIQLLIMVMMMMIFVQTIKYLFLEPGVQGRKRPKLQGTEQ